MRQKTNHRGELVQMYVSPKHNGKGIGRQLIKLTVQKAFDNPNIEQITLGVADKNNKAKQLYEEIGFKKYGKLENYFKTENKSITRCFMCLNKFDYHN